MLSRIKEFLIGPPLPTRQLAHERLNKIRALASFSPDALSSIAYANQEIFLGLVVAGSAGLSLTFPIGAVVGGLLILVALSYYQVVQVYTSGGGSYEVAHKNLGTLPGLVTAAALLVDYILVAAVSLTAGVAAIASAYPVLWPYRVTLALLLLFVITLPNLRGLRETGSVMCIPVYLFLFTYLPMLAYGGARALLEGPGSLAAAAPPANEPLTLLLILHTFSSGCTALTGIEAISNGVPYFKRPESKNAGRTLVVMALLLGVLFIGSIGLTQYLAVIAGPEETILSALARRVLGDGLAYQVIQIATMLLLTVAANTAFSGFPRLAAVLAGDGFLPRQLDSLGDRLVYNNGILLLAVASGLLIVLFGGDTHALIPLFAIGVFTAFTLSQIGMVVHWREVREQDRRWWMKALLNGVGGVATAITLAVISISKFVAGAWISLLLIPTMVFVFLQIRAHYREVAQQLSLRGVPPSLTPSPPLRAVVPISGVHRGVINAVNLARSISEHVTAVYVELEPGAGEHIREEWERWWPDVSLVVVPSPYRSVIGPLLDFLDETDRQYGSGQLAAIVLPEYVPAKWWHVFLHNQTAWLLKAAVLYRRRYLGSQRVIIDVPFRLRR